MSEILTTSNVTFALGIIGILFSIFLYFRTPQEALDKKQAIDVEKNDGKLNLFDEKMKWEKESNNARFAEVQQNIKDSFSLAQNHVHTVDTKVDALKVIVEQIGKDIVRLTTTIEERIPKK